MQVAMHVLVRGTNCTQYHDQVRNLRGKRQHMMKQSPETKHTIGGAHQSSKFRVPVAHALKILTHKVPH